jgi:hypothetical protein
MYTSWAESADIMLRSRVLEGNIGWLATTVANNMMHTFPSHYGLG